MLSKPNYITSTICTLVVLFCLSALQVNGQGLPIPAPTPKEDFKIPNPIPNQEPILESRGNYFGLNIPYIFQWQSQPYAGLADLSASLIKLKLLNGLLLDIDHNRVRNPLTQTLDGDFKIEAFGQKLYDYKDELESGNGWFRVPPTPTFDQMQANTNEALNNFQRQAQDFLNNPSPYFPPSRLPPMGPH